MTECRAVVVSGNRLGPRPRRTDHERLLGVLEGLPLHVANGDGVVLAGRRCAVAQIPGHEFGAGHVQRGEQGDDQQGQAHGAQLGEEEEEEQGECGP